MPPTENRKRSMRQQPRHKKNAVGTKNSLATACLWFASPRYALHGSCCAMAWMGVSLYDLKAGGQKQPEAEALPPLILVFARDGLLKFAVISRLVSQ